MSIAFFGATGGCANACLAAALKNGKECRALVRTPAKLENLLAEQKISAEILEKQLTIVKGDIRDLENVKETLAGADKLVSAIVSGIGSYPAFQMSLKEPITNVDPDVCEDFTANLLKALEDIKKSSGESYKAPLVSVVSTTGISSGPEDVPFGYRILYHYTLKVAHKDKRKMEALLRGPQSAEVFSKVVIVRATLLGGTHLLGSGVGYKALHVGTEEKPWQGYLVKRCDIGEWIFEEVLQRKWGGEKVEVFTLTQ